MISTLVGSVAKWVKASFSRPRFHDFNLSRQRGQMGKGVVFTTTTIEWSTFNSDPGHVFASLIKTLYNDYLCLVVSNKYQIEWTKVRKNPQEHWIIGNSRAGADFSNHEVVVVMKGVRIVQ